MSAPDQVPELPGWIFIRDHPIAKEVERYEPGRVRLARYVDTDGAFPDGQLAVMRLFFGELPGQTSNERWRSWIIAIRCLDPEGRPMTGEPNSWIIKLMQAFDSWAHGRDAKHIQKFAERVRIQRDKASTERFLNSMDKTITATASRLRREAGVKNTIYVPKGVEGE